MSQFISSADDCGAIIINVGPARVKLEGKPGLVPTQCLLTMWERTTTYKLSGDVGFVRTVREKEVRSFVGRSRISSRVTCNGM